MMADRPTCRARDLTDDTYIYHHGHSEIRHIAKAYTVGDRTYLIYTDGRRDDFEAGGVVALATEAEIAAYRREQDRFAVARALTRLGSQICDRGLPVPAGGVGIVVSLYLADDSDLEPWADYLSTRPRRGTALPLIRADAEGVEINVYRSGEFGPDLADPNPHYESGGHCTCGKAWPCPDDQPVEHRDSVGAFPIVASPWTGCGRCGAAMKQGAVLCSSCETFLAVRAVEEMRAEENAPERDGWSVSDGHRPPVDEDAMKHDRHSGEG